MNSCEEILQDVIYIIPIESGKLGCDIPFNVGSMPTLSVSSFSLVGSRYNSVSALVSQLKSRRCFLTEASVEGGTHARSVFIEEKPSIKATSKTGTMGRYFDTKVSAKSIDDVESVTDFVNEVAGWPWFDLFLIDSDDNLYFLRGQRSASNIELNQALPSANTHDIDLQIMSVNGVQKIE